MLGLATNINTYLFRDGSSFVLFERFHEAQPQPIAPSNQSNYSLELFVPQVSVISIKLTQRNVVYIYNLARAPL